MYYPPRERNKVDVVQAPGIEASSDGKGSMMRGEALGVQFRPGRCQPKHLLPVLPGKA